MLPSFEELLRVAVEMPLGASDLDRRVHWFGEQKYVGLAKQASGRVEIFIVGDEIVARSPLVSKHLRWDEWAGADGERFGANRLVLPSDEHFIASAAFLIEELFRHGVLVVAQSAFGRCEPTIELFLRRVALDDAAVQGLFAELLVLEMGLQVSTSIEAAARVLGAWTGWSPSSRDFYFGGLAIEVKSTRSMVSRHRVSGIEQANARRSDDGVAVEQLFIVSIGVHVMETDAGRSLPELVSGILDRIDSLAGSGSPLYRDFLTLLSNYGGAEGSGYCHDLMKDLDAYGRRFVRTFLRIYDMTDPRIRVLRSVDVEDRVHTPQSSIEFDIELPTRVDGDINPTLDLRALMQRALS